MSLREVQPTCFSRMDLAKLTGQKQQQFQKEYAIKKKNHQLLARQCYSLFSYC